MCVQKLHKHSERVSAILHLPSAAASREGVEGKTHQLSMDH